VLVMYNLKICPSTSSVTRFENEVFEGETIKTAN
jgi:hypothetical protein